MSMSKDSNPNAISVRLKGMNYAKTAFQRRHDLRLGKLPSYVDLDRSTENSVLVESLSAGDLKRLCEARRDPKLRAMASNSSVSVGGIITFGSAIQGSIKFMGKERQVEALKIVSEAIANRLKGEITGLVIHRDESAIHVHFQMPSIREDGKPLSKVMTPTVMSELQDIAFEAMSPFAMVERGNKKLDRIKSGAKLSDTINRSVKELHHDLPLEIDQKRQELEALEGKIRKHEERLAKLHAIEELTEKERKRLEIYERRAKEAQQKFDQLTSEIERLRSVKNQVENSVEFTADGQAQFEQAMVLQSEAMDEALALNPKTPEIVKEKYEQATMKNGEHRTFSTEESQNLFVHRFIKYCFNEVAKFFSKIKRSIALAEYARTVPEPLQQLQNHIDCLEESISETLQKLGVADQKIDLGEQDEKGDPPPILELVMSRARQKAARLNQTLAQTLSMRGPSI